MTIQEKKDYLAQYKSLNRRITRNDNEIKEWEEKIRTISTFGSYAGDIQGLSKKIYNFIKLLRTKQKDLIFTQKRIENAIKSTENERFRSILTYRYIEGSTIEHIAETINYSTRYTNTLINEAVASVVLD